jgi:hypothetical protein
VGAGVNPGPTVGTAGDSVGVASVAAVEVAWIFFKGAAVGEKMTHASMTRIRKSMSPNRFCIAISSNLLVTLET